MSPHKHNFCEISFRLLKLSDKICKSAYYGYYFLLIYSLFTYKNLKCEKIFELIIKKIFVCAYNNQWRNYGE